MNENANSEPSTENEELRPLRVGLDGRAFDSPAAGVRRYVQGLVHGLVELDEALDIVILGGRVRNVLPNGVTQTIEPFHPPTNVGWTLVGLPRAARRARVNVLHAPAYTAPLWSPAPVVVTIHDVSYARHPEWYPYRRDPLRRVFYRCSAKGARAVITDSQFSAEEIQAAYGIDPRRVFVAPLGVDGSFAAPDSNLACELPDRVTSPFVLHVGDLHERRNLALVVEALLQARRHFGVAPALSLVLAGIDRGVGHGLCEIASRAGAPEAVVRLGEVSEPQLRALYRCAAALVYPSLYEGFGLPVLEAMACGTPVIASRAASMPEVAGDAALLLDPHDASAWANAMVLVVNDDDVRTELKSKGLARASAFTWARTARTTLGVYRQVVSEGQRA